MADSEFPYEHERYQRFNESLDEVGTIQIAGTEFLPSRKDNFGTSKNDSRRFFKQQIAHAFGGTFAKPHKPTLKPSFAKEPPSQRTTKPTRK